MTPKTDGPVLGIDLGTTFSATAHVNRHGVPEVIANSEGSRTTPSVVYFEPDGPPIVGSAARNIALSDPDRTAQSIKRHMGDPSFNFTVDGKDYLPEAISALILRQLKADAEARLGMEITRAVISVPAYFMDSQKTATRTAGDLAGLDVLHTLNEPTAAAIAYGLGKAETKQTVMVYDFGGGTFDVTVLTIEGNEFLVRSTQGDAQLGGVDVDDRVAAYLAEQFQTHRGLDLFADPFTRLDLRERAETAKKDLSARQSVMVTLGTGADALRVDLDRARLSELIGDLVERTKTCMEQALDEASLRWPDIDAVLLVGGSSRIAAVREMIRSVTGKELGLDVNPDEAVAMGAAIRGGLSDLTERFDVRDSSGDAVPTSEQVSEVGIVVRDVAPHSLGVRAFSADGTSVNSIIIKRLTEVPCERERVYATRADGQQRIEVEVLQGENPDPYSPEVEAIGRLVLDNLPERPAGEVQVTVTLRYDADGLVEVEAEELIGGKRAKGQLLRKSGELDDEVLEHVRKNLDDLEDIQSDQVPDDEPPSSVDAGESHVEIESVDGVETGTGTGTETEDDSIDGAVHEIDGDGNGDRTDFDVDLYAFLGVPSASTTDELRKAIEESETVWQDRLEGARDDTQSAVANLALRNLKASRTHLLDETQRAAYDEWHQAQSGAPPESEHDSEG